MGGPENDDSDDTTTNNEPHDRDETGQFPTKVKPEEILTYLDEHRGASTAELAEAFDVSSETIRRKCYELVNREEVRARDVGGGIFWQLTPDDS